MSTARKTRKDSAMSEDVGKLILRLTLGILMLFHGYAKIAKGVSGIEASVVNMGLPAFVAYGVYIGEVLAPLLVILGFYARAGGAFIVISMLFAFTLSHSKQLFDLGRTGGWALELQGFFLLTGLVILLIGPGKFSINRR
jgi:putative oxidoreductase